MTIEPERRSRYGETMSESIAHWPRSLNDLPVGLFQIIFDGREGFAAPSLVSLASRQKKEREKDLR
jgi:hypothetical protein